MAKVIIDNHGSKKYLNDLGQPHRDDGPAIIHRNGHKVWIIDGHWQMLCEYNFSYLIRMNDNTHFRSWPSGYQRLEIGGRGVWPEL